MIIIIKFFFVKKELDQVTHGFSWLAKIKTYSLYRCSSANISDITSHTINIFTPLHVNVMVVFLS